MVGNAEFLVKEKYGGLMDAEKIHYKFLINLPLFHNRVMMIYPKLTPPEFKISDVQENSFIYIIFLNELD